MKNLKTFEQLHNNNDDNKLRDIFNDIQENYNPDNLSRFDSGVYGYYFRYNLNNGRSGSFLWGDIEVGLLSVRLNGELLSVSQPLIREIVDFFETKNKGKIRPDLNSSPGW